MEPRKRHKTTKPPAETTSPFARSHEITSRNDQTTKPRSHHKDTKPSTGQRHRTTKPPIKTFVVVSWFRVWLFRLAMSKGCVVSAGGFVVLLRLNGFMAVWFRLVVSLCYFIGSFVPAGSFLCFFFSLFRLAISLVCCVFVGVGN